MLISEFDYDLPEELIAQEPPRERENSRMLAVCRSTNELKDLSFRNFPSFVGKNDLLVLNNTKVFPARLIGRSETGAAVELFLVEEISDGLWLTLARPARRLRPGKRVIFSEKLAAIVEERTEDGRIIARFDFEGELDQILDETGKTPLPPYIKRNREGPDTDRGRYQTVYASRRGAIAAPTAGFHFTPRILEEIRDLGAEVVEITLHVGYGTFEPVKAEDLSEHTVQPEKFEIEDDAARALNRAKRDGRRIVAIGTTTTRALETVFSEHGEFVAGRQTADLTITPGYEFKAIDALLTNFHLPRSSLLVLVSTFGGHGLIMEAYRHAVRERYRFYSYGDCMFVY